MAGDIINIIDEVHDGKIRRRRSTEGIMVHRCGVDLQTGTVLGYSGRDVCDAFLGRVPQFEAAARATGHQNPYSFLVGGNLGPEQYDGEIWQALPLHEVGYHGRRFSAPYIGVSCIGDFREQAPSPAQYSALCHLLAALCAKLGLDAYRDIRGHGEVDGAHDGSKAPGKPAACPGDLLSMNKLRYSVDELGPQIRPLSIIG